MSTEPQMQAVRRAVFPYQWMLPFGQVMICMALLWPSRGIIAWNLGFHLPLRLIGSLSFEREDRVLKSVTALNLPGALLDLPYAIISPTHQSWAPPGVDPRTWNAVTAPFLGLFFWWLPGRALEALSAVKYRQLAPRIGWTETIVGLLIMAGGTTLLIGFMFFTTPSERADLMQLAAGGALWSVLGGVSVAARIAQWRAKKQLAVGK